jgi:glucose-1-phosphate cytidylyltransferase
MKVVLFCGGFGTRMRDYSVTIPKPMVDIGYRPLLWNLMKYYAHYGINEFILCLGYQADVIKKYFMDYKEWLSNDFVMTNGGRDINLLNTDIQNWEITFVDTGLKANIGQRLRAVRKYLVNEPVFMANYADGLTDMYLSDYLEFFYQHNKIASFITIQPSQSFHVVSLGEDSVVENIKPVTQSDLWINGGFFIFKNEIFDYLYEGEELVLEPFQRLIAIQELIAYRYNGFWACLDTYKEKQLFDDMYSKGITPWTVWQK